MATLTEEGLYAGTTVTEDGDVVIASLTESGLHIEGDVSITISPAVATATAAGPVPTLIEVVLPGAAAATASGPTPTIAEVVLPAAAGATADAPAPSIPGANIVITPPVADAAASGPTPSLAETVITPAAAATAAGPTPVISIVLISPAAGATADGPTPTIVVSGTGPITIMAPVAEATAEGISPISPSRLPEIAAVPMIPAVPRGLGSVTHEIIGPDGDSYFPDVQDWEALEESPGGMSSQQGRVSAEVVRRHRNVFRSGARWHTYLEEDGEIVASGVLKGVYGDSGTSMLVARGTSWRADKFAERILCQTRDLSPFVEQNTSEGLDFSLASGPESSLNELAGYMQWQASKGTEAPDAANIRTSLVVGYFPDARITRIAGTITANWDMGNFSRPLISSIPAAPTRAPRVFFASRAGPYAGNAVGTLSGNEAAMDDVDPGDVRRGTYENAEYQAWDGQNGVFTGSRIFIQDFDIDVGFGDVFGPFDGTQDPTALNYFRKPNVLEIEVDTGWSDTEGGNIPATIFTISNFRINGLAEGDFMSASELATAVFGMIGIRSFVDPIGVNILPYDLVAGHYSDALDYASLMGGWPWRILHTGDGPYGEFREPDTWGLADPRAPWEAIPATRYNRCRVEYTAAHGKWTGYAMGRAEHRDIIHEFSDYGLVDLGTPVNGFDHARHLANRIADVLLMQRHSGSATLSELRNENDMPVSPYKARAGDKIRHLSTRPMGIPTKSIRKTTEAVTVEFDDGTHIIERIAAKRARRASAAHAEPPDKLFHPPRHH